MNKIFDYTEQKWLEYVELIPDREVKYLLIGEAPPGTDDNPPLYFLDPGCPPRTLMKAVCPAFFGCPSTDGKRTLDRLAREGFLLVDSLPFAMKYTSRMRSCAAYSRLIDRTVNSYMHDKLISSSLSWSGDLRIGFTVPRNARCVMAALQHTLQLDNREFFLADDMMVTGAANYPNRAVLREVFHLGKTSF